LSQEKLTVLTPKKAGADPGHACQYQSAWGRGKGMGSNVGAEAPRPCHAAFIQPA
jgi:hypothetical protein